MDKFEYVAATLEKYKFKNVTTWHVIRINYETVNREPFYEFLARSGKDGWELAGIISEDPVTLILKRPLP